MNRYLHPITGLSALGITACLVAPEDNIITIAAVVFSILFVVCVFFRLSRAIKDKDKRFFLRFNKYSWFTCGLSLVLAAGLYNKYGYSIAIVFLILAAISFLFFIADHLASKD